MIKVENEIPVNGSVAYWEKVRVIVREEINQCVGFPGLTSVPGLTSKPLYKMKEICLIFDVSRQTIYEWIKAGKLRPVKIRSRVYFLWKDVEELIEKK